MRIHSLQENFVEKNLENWFLTSGVDFTNILGKALLLRSQKSKKETDGLTVFFALAFGICAHNSCA
jgi:hypothetical protein